MRTPIRLLAVSGLLVGALVAAAGPAQAGSHVTIEKGHVDVIGVAYEDGRLHLHVHDESIEPDVEREPEGVTFRVLPEAETTVPADPSFSFLGSAGDPVWILPQVQNPDLLWAGLGTEELEPGILAGDTVNVTVLAVGPGDVALYTENAFGLPADVLVDTGDGQPDTFGLTAANHVHLNWAFEEPGNYWLVVAVTGRLASNGHAVADAGLYHFQVLS